MFNKQSVVDEVIKEINCGNESKAKYAIEQDIRGIIQQQNIILQAQAAIAQHQEHIKAINVKEVEVSIAL